MTIDEFNKTGWTGGMKCTYQGQDYDIGSANFEEKLVGLCMGHDFGTVEHRFELRKCGRQDFYDVYVDGKLWKLRIGWSRVLEGLRKSLPRKAS